jgi:maltooligosyltrehalose trehalohydrolase
MTTAPALTLLPAPVDPEPGVVVEPDGGCLVNLWAPRCHAPLLVPEGGEPLRLAPGERGWWSLRTRALKPGDRYRFRLDDGRELPDPASRHQPAGVHGPSAVADLAAFPWTDQHWRGRPLEELVLYELHLGTFTDEGTCDAAIARLDHLVALGVTAVELMPVAQCPGTRNWGYDGVLPFAVQHSLGGPAALQRLVDACHARGLAVILDVVYNHFGPEGNHLDAYMPITSERFPTPWGAGVNLHGAGSDGVRGYLLANARHWFTGYHVDGLRLDAVHALVDIGARHFLSELSERTRAWELVLGRPLHLIAECDLNASRMVRPVAEGGHGLDSQWSDDFHHALHALLTGEDRGYYRDFGGVEDLRAAFAHGWAYAQRWSGHRGMTVGDDATDLPTASFTVCAQNHDQVGNRFGGERLSLLTDAEGLKCAAAAVLLSPFLPLLFMGEEWGERRPFLYFVDHSDPALVAAVRRSREGEFAALNAGVPYREPFAAETRDACRLDWAAAQAEPGRTLLGFHRECLRLRRILPSLRPGPRERVQVGGPHADVITVERRAAQCRTLLLLNPTARTAEAVPLPAGTWEVELASPESCWGGPGWGEGLASGALTLPPRSAVLLAWPQDEVVP